MKPFTNFHPAVVFAIGSLVALFVRLAVLHQISHDPRIENVGGDGLYYLTWSDQIAGGEWIGHKVFYPSPLYPYLLAAIQKLLGPTLQSILNVQVIVGATGCGLLALAAAKLFDPTVGLVAGLMLAFYPAAISYDLQIDKTVLDAPLIAALLWCLGSLVQKPSWQIWMGCGIALGVLSLTRENAIALSAPILLWTWWHFRALAWRKRAAWSLVLLGGVALIVLPVCLRNTLIGGEFQLTTAKFGANFYYGNSAAADGIYFPLRPGRGDLRFEQQDATELAEQAMGRKLTLGEVSSYWTHRTLREMADDPKHWMIVTARKLAMVWADTEIADADVHDRHIVFSSLLRLLDAMWGFGILFALAMAGAVLQWKLSKQSVLILLGLVVFYALAIAAFILFGRYRLPLVPILIPLAAAALVVIPSTFQQKNWLPLIGGAIAALFALGLVHVGDRSIPDRIRGTNPYNRALVRASLGQTEAAISEYQRAIRQNPNLESAYVNLSLLRSDRGEFSEARRLAERAIQLNPNDPAAHLNLGLALVRSGWADQAVSAFRRAVELDPSDRAGRLDLAAGLLQMGQRTEALLMLNDLATTQPADEFSQRAKALLNDGSK